MKSFAKCLGWLTILLATSLSQLHAQISEGGVPYSISNSVGRNAIPSVLMPPIYLSKLQREDKQDEENGQPPRFGKKFDVQLNLNNSGLWEILPNGNRLWRLHIHCPNALSINLVFNDFWLPEGGKLFIYNEEQTHILGAFTAQNNKGNRNFGTGLIYGEAVILEYYEPQKVANQGSIQIAQIVHGYRYIQLNPPQQRGFGDSGACNINVICPEGDDWRNEIKSVALMLMVNRICSGALINNTRRDGMPLFLTANHCLPDTLDAINNPNADNFVFYWRYESPDCSPSQDGPQLTTSGATVLANSASGGHVSQSDFALLRLIENPASEYDVYFAGWDASGNIPASATGIHHPKGDVKKISHENEILTITDYGGFGFLGDATHWRVNGWASGVTEGGSSGSPLFDDATHKIVGVLSGGGSACGTIFNLSDYYGRLAWDWCRDTTDARRRLKDWLDPNNSGITDLDGEYNPHCNRVIPISCGATVTDNTTGGINSMATYNCWDYMTGPEHIYQVTTTEVSEIKAELKNAPFSSVLILENCDSQSCLDKGFFNASYEGIPDTYYVVVDGSFGKKGPYELEVTCTPICDNAIPIQCNETLSGTTIGKKKIIDKYSCTPWNESGPEVIYSITTTQPGDLTASLTNMTGNLDVFILNACNPDSCLTKGNYNAVLENAPPGTYYIVVDGYEGAEGDYQLTVTCGDLDCSNAVPLECGAIYTGNTSAESNKVMLYDCLTFSSYTGPEKVHTVTTTEPGDLTVFLDAHNGNSLGVFILSDCDPKQCVANGVTTATYANAPPGLYYIVVDGANGAKGSYDLQIVCSNNSALDCSNAIELNCGQSYWGSLLGASNQVNDYSCSDWNEGSPEQIYKVETSQPGDIIVQVSSLNGNGLNAYILTACNPNACVAGGSSLVTYENAPPGIYYIVVDGYTGAANLFNITIKCSDNNTVDCSNAQEILCGQTVWGSTFFSTNNVSQYNCASQNWSGPENVYAITTTEFGNITATIEVAFGGDLDVLILDACNRFSCEAVGNTQATLNNAPPSRYYIVVEGFEGAKGTYNLNVECSSICDAAIPIHCGQIYNGNTSVGSDGISQYNCQPEKLFTGREVVHVLQINNTRDIVAKLTLPGNPLLLDLDVFILDVCNPDACLAYGDNEAIAFNAPPGTYYIVVDGAYDFNRNYSLEIECIPPFICVLPFNTTCANAFPVSISEDYCEIYELNYNNECVIPSEDNLPPCAQDAVQSLWFQFKAPECGYVEIMPLYGTASWLSFAVYEECETIEIACFDNGEYGLVQGLTPGKIYYLQAWSNETDAGTFNICLRSACGRDNMEVTFPEISNTPSRLLSKPTETVLKLFPNPVRYHVTIEYEVLENTLVSFSLYDSKGRLVKVLHESQQSQGIYQLKKRVNDIEEGIYFLQFKTHYQTYIERLIIVH